MHMSTSLICRNWLINSYGKVWEGHGVSRAAPAAKDLGFPPRLHLIVRHRVVIKIDDRDGAGDGASGLKCKCASSDSSPNK